MCVLSWHYAQSILNVFYISLTHFLYLHPLINILPEEKELKDEDKAWCIYVALFLITGGIKNDWPTISNKISIILFNITILIFLYIVSQN